MLVSRTVRDRQFRKRVLDVYDCRCALTGMKLINGGGRAEAQAAHIMSVEAGGPDVVTNGIALSGTVHWMFDRGLISLGDDGGILLSRKINDIEGVSKLLYRDRKARLPASNAIGRMGVILSGTGANAFTPEHGLKPRVICYAGTPARARPRIRSGAGSCRCGSGTATADRRGSSRTAAPARCGSDRDARRGVCRGRT